MVNHLHLCVWVIFGLISHSSAVSSIESWPVRAYTVSKCFVSETKTSADAVSEIQILDFTKGLWNGLCPNTQHVQCKLLQTNNTEVTDGVAKEKKADCCFRLVKGEGTVKYSKKKCRAGKVVYSIKSIQKYIFVVKSVPLHFGHPI